MCVLYVHSDVQFSILQLPASRRGAFLSAAATAVRASGISGESDSRRKYISAITLIRC